MNKIPKRIQMTRNKPWRCDNPDAVIVARPTKWGNIFVIGDHAENAEQATDMFHCMFFDPDSWKDDYPMDELHELRGKDLACWCALDSPCHADVLLRMANINEMENG